MTPEEFETAARATPHVSDARVVTRVNRGGERETLVFAVAAAGADAMSLTALLQGRLEGASVCVLPAVPLGTQGAWDRDCLDALAVLDDETLAEAQRQAHAATGRESVAIGATRAASPSSWHLADVFPDWTRPALAAPTASSLPIAPAPEASTVPALSDGGALNLPADAPRVLADMLARAAGAPAPAGLVIVGSEGTEHEIGYPALQAQALRILAGLHAAGLRPGDALVLLLRRHEDFLPTFWACLLGGIVAVPEAVPQNMADGAASKRLANVLQMFEQPVLAGDAALLVALSAAAGLPAHRALDVEALRQCPVDGVPHSAAADDIALMMLTSGSTGRPKGVPLSHRCLIARTLGTVAANRTPRGVVSLNWMPLNHVAGLLLSHLQDVHLAARQVLVQIDDILRSPLLWLDLLERHRVEFTFAPNFAFGLVNAQAEQMVRRRWDLSRLAFIMNGGEAIVAATARRFLTLLQPHGLPADAMVPAWGMSELCSGVTYEHGFRLDTTRDSDTCVKVGKPMPGVRLRIVDDRGALLREGQIGHLQIACDSLFGGYHGNVPPREQTFSADGWFNTGDLARLDDGTLTITGREKDEIIINGANHAGAAIESSVEEVPGVAASFTAACAVADPRADGGEGLGLFFVPEVEGDEALSLLLRAIRRQVMHGFGIGPALIVPLSREQVPKTSIGKIQRSALKKALAGGAFEAVLRRVDLLTENEHTLPRWLFRRGWHERDAAAAAAPAGPLLIVGERLDPLAQALLAAAPGSVWLSAGLDALDDGVARDLARAKAQLTADGLSPQGLVWLVPPSTTQAGSVRCAGIALMTARLVPLLAQAGLPLTLAAVTRQALPVAAGDGVDPAAAALGAWVHTLVQEHAGCHALHVDADGQAPQGVAAGIVRDLRAGTEQREVAWRAGRRLLPLLEPVMDAALAPTGPLRQGGRYVITGGLGGIAVELAAWLASALEAQVLLLSRTGLAADDDTSAAAEVRRAAWQRLSAPGPRVSHAVADVADANALRTVLADAAARWGGEADAVFHLAGHYHEAPLAEEDAAGLARSFQPKVDGLQALLSARSPATAIVCFSSAASLFSGALVGAYAAANRAMDALAVASPRVWSLAWSSWQNVGLTRRHGAREPLRAMGILDLPLPQALASLRLALAQPPGLIAIGLSAAAPAVARRSIGVPLRQSITVFCEGPVPAGQARTAVTDRHGVACPVRLQSIEALPRSADGGVDRDALRRLADHGLTLRPPQGPVESRLAGLWQRVLGVPAIGTDTSFFELGGQSLLASQLITAIGAAFGVHWTLRDVFEAPTIAAQAQRLAAAGASAAGGAGDSVVRADRSQPLPLASAQQRLWFLDQVHPGNSAFNIPASIRFEAAPDPARVQRALQRLVDRHDSLRTRFPQHDGKPRQVIASHESVAMTVERLADAAAVDAWTLTEARTGFDLAAGPLLRARLGRVDGGGAVLLLTLHHIVGDGWSMKVLFRDWLEAYQTDAPLRPAALQYADFAAWQHAQAEAGRHAQQVVHWQRRLGDNLDGFTLPTDRPRPAVQSYCGATVRSRLPAALTRRVRALARERGVTLFVVLLAAYKALLARYAQQSDVVVGSVVANRDRAEFEALIGFMVNVVVLRTRLDRDPSFAELLQRVHDTVLDAHAHHEVPFEVLVDALRPPRDSSRSPLFQIAFDLRDPEITRSPLPGVALGVMEPDLGAVQYDLHLTLEEGLGEDAALTALWQFNTDLFDAATVTRMARNFEVLLADAVDQPAQRLSRLALLHPEERAFIEGWNQREAAFADGRCLHHLFEDHAERTPDRTALVFGGATLSYAQLEARSNAWAQRLQELGVGPDVCVGLCLPRSIELIVALLGILKAGGAFLPLDPTYPQERLDHMAADAGIRHLITDRDTAPRYAAAEAAGLQLLRIDDEMPAAPRPSCAATARSLAYVIYTSGSTGRPKGVLVEHRGWCNVAQAQQDTFGLRPGLRVLQFASSSFDACAFEIAMALASGGTLVLGTREDLMPGPALAQLLREQRVEVVTLPPTALTALPAPQGEAGGPDDYPDLRVITVAGEPCPLPLVQRWASARRRFFNLYGPTEATIWSSVAECRGDDAQAPPIGVPVPNARLYVLDAQRQLLPLGMPGELYIGGVGVARGYHARPELDAQRFVADAFAPVPQQRAGARLYRSGDVVRLDAGGQLQFLGRTDHQVKLRGFRIELGEIDALLRERPEIAEALVTVHRLPDGEAALAAFVAPRAGAALDVDAVRRELRSRLPEHMVPSWIVALPEFPLLVNGKIDRHRLPDPQRHGARSAAGERPQTALEQAIAAVWREVLQLEALDRHQNFFEAGGHSIKMAQVHARLAAELQGELTRPLSLVDLFQHPTVAALAAHLATQMGGASGQAAAPAEATPARPAAPARPDAQRLAALAQRQRAARRPV